MIPDGFETYMRTELGLSQNTITGYLRDIRDFVSFCGSTNNISLFSIERFVIRLRDMQLSRATIRRKCMSIRCLVRHMVSLGQISADLLEMLTPIRSPKGANHNALHDKDVDVLLDNLRSRIRPGRADYVCRNIAIVLTLYDSGLRVSELCGLNVSDVDTKKRSILVRGKGGRDRVVPTTHRCAKAINDYVSNNRSTATDALFVKTNGNRITRNDVYCVLTSGGANAITPHSLRRGCATTLIERGVDIELIQKLLGHQHVSATEAYLCVDGNRLAEVHKRCHPFGAKHEV